jgi:hypothetical protein
VGTASSHHVTRRKRTRRLIWFAVALVLLIVPTLPTIAAVSPVRVINTPGFGESQNSYAWSMAWFKGYLYVGTVRSEACVESATYQRFGIGTYSEHPNQYVTCPASPYDMDLRAEIWRYNPVHPTWQRVYQSPADVPIAEAPGKIVARDIGFRGMVVYTDPNSGEQYLMVAGDTAGVFIPSVQENYAPRILWTSDGVNFTPVNGAPDLIYTIYDPVNGEKPVSYRATVQYGDQLIVTSGSGLTGDGVMERIDNPLSQSPTFTQVSPAGMDVYELSDFNNQLYAGIADPTNGYGVVRTDAQGPAPYQFTTVVSNGAGRGKTISSVVSMHVFDNRLYVGASGWYNTIFPPSELIRIAPDDTWQVVVGNPRNTTEGYQFPISGLPDGFGNLFNAHFWRMEDLNQGLYVGTNDWSWLLKDVPLLKQLLGSQFGFDVYGSCDGQSWFRVTSNAFNSNPDNFGARTMQSSPFGGFIGSANNADGTSVFATNSSSGILLCGAFSLSNFWNMPFASILYSNNGKINRKLRPPTFGSNTFDANSDASRPKLLQADVQTGGTVLSWEPSQGATQYQVLRAEYVPNSKVGVPAPQKPLVTGPLDPALLGPESLAAGSGTPDVDVLGNFVNLGTTSDPYFVDSTAATGVKYAYTVQAVGPSNQLSSTSNVIVVPDGTPDITYQNVIDSITSMASNGQLSQDAANSLIAMLNTSQTQLNQSDLQDSIQTLGSVISQVMPGSGKVPDDVNAQGLALKVSSLQRRVALVNIAGQETGAPLGDGSQSGNPPSNPGTPPSNGGSTPSSGGSAWGSLNNPLFPFGFPTFRRAW